MSFGVACVALCDIPRVCEVRDPREAKVAVRIGKVTKTCLFHSFSTSCRFAWQAWGFVTFHVCEVRDPCEDEVAVPMGKVAKTCLF